MLESLWDGQTSYTKLARLLGVDRGTLIRRLRVLQFRLGELRNCLLIDHLNDLPPDFRPVAVDHFVRGLTTRCIAETRGLSRIVVRTMLAYVRGYLNALDKSSAAS